MLNMLNSPDKKIITLEDPVEYELPGIEQSQINEKKWYTFEEGLKWILRHDPDIIMVGEIRSYESAQMAINAALTWHLVISTLHTNSAVEAIPRLINMGVKPFMLAAALSLVIAQRLVRKIARSAPMPASRSLDTTIKGILQRIKKSHPHMDLSYDGTIPSVINGKNNLDDGYAGRIALMETLTIDETIKHGIMENLPSDQLLALALKQWYLTMEDDAYLKLIAWQTSIEEIRRVL
jgi:type II secretory ATPase GspE/PulE/Tfp pilus assembly ATPase PilB-like protein